MPRLVGHFHQNGIGDVTCKKKMMKNRNTGCSSYQQGTGSSILTMKPGVGMIALCMI